MNKKIGILGGTFDPIHLGHILIAKQAMEEYSLDEIWFLPTGKSPHKEASEVTSTFHRLNMVELAIQPYSKFFLCDYETKQEKVNYTFQTLKHLTEQYQETTFYFIMGQDSIKDFPKWKEPSQICKYATLLVAIRQEVEYTKELEEDIAFVRRQYHATIKCLHSPNFPVSSSQIRVLARKKQQISEFVPKEVEEYIIENHIYQSN